MEQIESITIQHQADHGMWGPEIAPGDPQHGIDEEASYRRYEEMVKAALVEEYPNADIIVEVGPNVPDRTLVNGGADHPEAPWIQQIYERIWSSWEWVVNATQ